MSAAYEETAKPSVNELRELFSAHLRDADRLKKPEGIATGLGPLDRFLFWRGLPKGGLSLLNGALGSGATSLWLEAANVALREGRWVAWVNGEVPLSPLSLYHKGAALERFVSIEKPETKKLFWLLQELMASSLFDLIGCDLDRFSLREHQARKLQAQAREAKLALVFLSRLESPRGSLASVFSLIVGFEKRRIRVERALHRPTPHSFPRSVHYARFTLHTGDRIGLGTDLTPAERAPIQSHSLSEAATPALAGV